MIWWNTSLSPRGIPQSSPEDMRVAIALINTFICELEADLIALGEVSTSDIEQIRDHVESVGYVIHEGVEQAGRSQFDTCVLYKPEKLTKLNAVSITVVKVGRTYRVAQRVDFRISEYDMPLHVFLSHWPSRMNVHQHDPIRSLISLTLRESVEEIFELYGQENAPLFALLGDFNDEPFDDSISQHLMATRDRGMAQRKMRVLYNPFWKRLGNSNNYSKDNRCENELAGSYFYNYGSSSRWYTFDQIIFSSGFLGGSDWHLNESLTSILDPPEYRDLVFSRKRIFDHFPVMAVIEKVA